VVVSLSPHLVETQSSEIEHSSRCIRWLVDELLGPRLASGSSSNRRSARSRTRRPACRFRECRRRRAWSSPARCRSPRRRRDIRVGAGADDGAEMQLQVFAELQTAIGVRDRQRALDVVGDGLAGRVGDVVHGRMRRGCGPRRGRFRAGSPGRSCLNISMPSGLLTSAWFCNCACGRGRPWDIGDNLADVLAIFDGGIALLRSFSAILWPIGTSAPAVSRKVELSWVMQHSMSVPAVSPSTTTTPTLSACSWTRRWGISDMNCLLKYLAVSSRLRNLRAQRPAIAQVVESKGLWPSASGRISVQSSAPNRPSNMASACLAEILGGVGVGADEGDFLQRHAADIQTACQRCPSPI
jgi:hypothetical protein